MTCWCGRMVCTRWRDDRDGLSAGSPRVNKQQVWAATGVCFLAKPVMTSHCGCGGLREK